MITSGSWISSCLPDDKVGATESYTQMYLAMDELQIFHVRGGNLLLTGQPKRGTSLAKSTLEVPLSEEKLSNQTLTTGQIGVMLHPTSTDVLEFSFFHILANPSKEFRIVHLEPFVLLRRWTGEAVLRILVHKVALGGPRTCYFAYIPPRKLALVQTKNSGNLTFSFVKWPEPACVNMAMTRSINKRISVGIVDLCRINILSYVPWSDFTTFNDRFLGSRDKCVDDFIGDLSSRVRFLFAVQVRHISWAKTASTECVPMSLLGIHERRLQESSNRYKEPAPPNSEPLYRPWTTESCKANPLMVYPGLGFNGIMCAY